MRGGFGTPPSAHNCLRQLQPEFHRRFDLLNDSRVNHAQTPLQFHDGDAADSLRVKSSGVKTARLMRDFKTGFPESGGARNVTDDGAFVSEIGDAEDEA